MKISRAVLCLTAATLAVAVGGCNLYSFMDKPSGDDQLLSKARACFDSGDLECAKTNYQAVSASNERAASESLFADLDSAGVDMKELINLAQDLKDHGTGQAISLMAGRMLVAGKTGKAQRLALFNIYKSAAGISSKELRGFVQFVAGIALTSEVLGEGSRDSKKVCKSDLVNSVSQCKAIDVCANATDIATDGLRGSSAYCGAPTTFTSHLTGTSTPSLFDGTTKTLTGNLPNADDASLDYLFDSLTMTIAAMESLGSGGDFSSLLNVITTARNVGSSFSGAAGLLQNCYRETLIKSDINFGEDC